MITNLLLTVVILLLLALIFLVRRKAVAPRDIESAFSKVWRESGVDERIGQLSVHARDIRVSHDSIEQMLRVPKERASFGEIALETILSDQLPPDMFGIRSRILNGKVPDAYIRSTVGLICIDSKFPLDNYLRMIEEQEAGQWQTHKKQFIKDVHGHLDKIAGDYISPKNGTAEFAFAYIPSEGVYYFLVNEAYDMLQSFTRKGVQVVSPLTISHKIELIKTGVHAKRLSEETHRVRDDLNQLASHFREIDELWRVFYESHLKNAVRRADDLDQAYSGLRETFHGISRFSRKTDEAEAAELRVTEIVERI